MQVSKSIKIYRSESKKNIKDKMKSHEKHTKQKMTCASTFTEMCSYKENKLKWKYTNERQRRKCNSIFFVVWKWLDEEGVRENQLK